MSNSPQTASVMAGGCLSARYSRTCCLTELPRAPMAVSSRGGFVGRDVIEKFVSAGASRAKDEVKSIGGGGLKHGLERRQSGIGNGAGRQPGMAVRVIWIFAVEVDRKSVV